MDDDVVRGGASAVLPPLVVLAVAVGEAVIVGFALADRLHGEISFSQFAPVIAGDAYALLACLFVWLDTAVVAHREGRPWVGAAQSWRWSGGAALGAVIGAAGLCVPITLAMAVANQANLIWPTIVGVPAMLLAGAGYGVKVNVRTRRRTPVGPPPPFLSDVPSRTCERRAPTPARSPRSCCGAGA